MPLCTLQTNLSGREIPEDFNNKLCELVADLLGKPKDVSKISVHDLSVVKLSDLYNF